MELLHFYLHPFLICMTSFSSGGLLHLSETLYKLKNLNKLFCQFAAFEFPLLDSVPTFSTLTAHLAQNRSHQAASALL